jgi:hypothetical protein
MARVDLPQSRLRQRRRRRRALIAGGIFLAVCALFGGMVWLSWAGPLRVTAITVEGAQTVASSTITAYVQQELAGTYFWMFPRNNVFLYPRAEIAQNILKQYPTLRAVDVHAQDFHTVFVKVAERQPVALWCPSGQVTAGEGCSFLDEEGLAYAPAPQFSAPVYVTYTGSLNAGPYTGLRQFLTPEEFQSLVALVTALVQKMPDNPVGLVAVDTNGDARAYFKDDFLLMFNLKDDGGDIFERFNLALSSSVFTGKTLADFEYLDLRFGDKLYYKLK